MTKLATLIAPAALLVLAHCAHPDPSDEEVAPELGQVTSTILSPYNTLTWLFPEGGATGAGHPDYHHFQTYYHLANLNDVSILAEARFQGGDQVWTYQRWLAPRSRTSVSFSEMSGGRLGFYSAEIYSRSTGYELQASSTMYNNSFGWQTWENSKAVNGATEARTVWYFGEGGAFGHGASPWDHYFVVYNPTNQTINFNTTYYPDQFDNGGIGPVPDPVRSVPPRSRLAFNPFTGQPPWTQLGSRAAVITCSGPCVAQMTMYQLNGWGNFRRPNTQSALGSAPSTKWYVVGIPTGNAWHNRLYLFNTRAEDGNPGTNDHTLVTLTYRNAAGTPLLSTSHSIPPQHRISYDLNGAALGDAPMLAAPQGYGGDNLSLEITASPHPIVATKIMYWSRIAWNEGASTTGHSIGGTKVVFPGGTSGGGHSNYVQVMNVGDQPTNVYATTYWPGGNMVTPERLVGSLNPKGMMQLDAASYLSGTGDFTTVLVTKNGQPLIAESSTYLGWDWDEPHLLWYAGDSVEGVIYNPTLPCANPCQP